MNRSRYPGWIILLHEKDRIIEKQAAEINTLSRKKVEDEMEPDHSCRRIRNLFERSGTFADEKFIHKK